MSDKQQYLVAEFRKAGWTVSICANMAFFLVPAGSNIFLGLCTVFPGKNCRTLARNGKVPLQDASECKKEIPQNVHNLSSPIKAYLCFIAMHFG